MKKIKAFLKDSYTRFFSLPLPAVLGSAVLLACCLVLLGTQITGFLSATREAAQKAAETPAPTVMVTSSPTPSPSPTAVLVKTHITATSSEADLNIVVRDEQEEAVLGEVFDVEVQYPGGSTNIFHSNEDGSCYLVNLEAGDYTITIGAKDGYVTADPLTASVKARVERTKIANISQVVEVTEAAAIVDEVKTESAPAPEVETVEEIITPAETVSEPEVTEKEVTVQDTDENNRPKYTVEIHTDSNGFILLKDGTSSLVKPVNEGDVESIYTTYGIVFEAVTREITVPAENTPAAESSDDSEADSDGETPAPEGSPSPEVQTITEYTATGETVALFDTSAGTVLGNYDITISPVMVTKMVTMKGDKIIETGWQTKNGNTYYYDNDGNMVTGLKSIDGKLYFFSDSGVRASSLGIDVSQFNGTIDWNAVKAQGIDFAIIRVGGRGWSSGCLYNDSCSYDNIRAAKNAGLQIGVYFYSTAVDTQEAVEEASLAIENLHGYSLDFPIYFDTELSGEAPYGRADQLSAAQQAQIAQAFCDTCRNSGYRAGVYSNQNYFCSNLDYSMVSGYSIWMASYTNNYVTPSFPYYYNMWQFTSGGTINGISGCVDMDVIF